MATNVKAEGSLNVIVIRKQRVIDTIFTVFVALFVSVIYINIGCAVDWSEIPAMLRKPIRPSIGFFGQFVILPLVSLENYTNNETYLCLIDYIYSIFFFYSDYPTFLY